MPGDQVPLPQRAANYFSVLCAASKDLNAISDELGKSIGEIDLALKKLNLGVAVWVPIHKDDGAPDESWYWSEDIGYAKVGANWGVCLRKVNGDYQRPDEDEREERWLFNDGPRTLRISAIEKIPDLLEKLSSEAARTANEIRAKLGEVQAVADAIKRSTSRVERAPLRVPHSPFQAPTIHARPGGPKMDLIRDAVTAALAEAGHHSAAELVHVARWASDEAIIRIEVPGIGKKMLALTLNAAAEKVIRVELERLGAQTRFLAVPGEAVGKTSEPTSDSVPSAQEEKQ